jgi:hypothetical protein
MKCLSLWQPWASLIAVGAKLIETRSWSTSHRGPVAIHAAALWGHKQYQLCHSGVFYRALSAGGAFVPDMRTPRRRPPFCLPLGCIVAVAKVVDCFQITPMSRPLDDRELAFGNYETGRYGWELSDIVRLERPIPFKGRQGLFTLPPDVVGQLPETA